MDRKAFRELLRDRVLVCDAPWDMIAAAPGDAPQPRAGLRELLAVENFDELVARHRASLAAGADVLLTNTFAANRPALTPFNEAGRLPEIIRRSIEAAREALPPKSKLKAGMPCVGCLIGPLPQGVGSGAGQPFEEAVEAYREVAKIAKGNEPDLFVIDAIGQIENLRAALIALRAVAPDVPVVVMMTFEGTGRTAEGSPPAVVAAIARSLGADAIGASGRLTPAEMLPIAAAFLEVSDLSLAFQPAAMPGSAEEPALRGAGEEPPEHDAGGEANLLHPQEFVRQTNLLLRKGCAFIGCSGARTTAHLEALAQAAAKASPQVPTLVEGVSLASRTRDVVIGPHRDLVTITEWPDVGRETHRLFEPMGAKVLARAVRAMVGSRTQMVEVRCTLPPEDEPRFFNELLPALDAELSLPLLINAQTRKGLESALRKVRGRAIVTGVWGEAKSFERVFPLAREYGAAVIAACHTGEDIPFTADERLKVAERILEAAIAAGLPHEDILFDPVTLPVHTDAPKLLESLRAIALIRETLGRSTVLRLSRASEGLPGRARIEMTLLAMAAAAGLDAAIVDGSRPGLIELASAASVVMGRDRDARRYLAHFSEEGTDRSGLRRERPPRFERREERERPPREGAPPRRWRGEREDREHGPGRRWPDRREAGREERHARVATERRPGPDDERHGRDDERPWVSKRAPHDRDEERPRVPRDRPYDRDEGRPRAPRDRRYSHDEGRPRAPRDRRYGHDEGRPRAPRDTRYGHDDKRPWVPRDRGRDRDHERPWDADRGTRPRESGREPDGNREQPRERKRWNGESGGPVWRPGPATGRPHGPRRGPSAPSQRSGPSAPPPRRVRPRPSGETERGQRPRSKPAGGGERRPRRGAASGSGAPERPHGRKRSSAPKADGRDRRSRRKK